MQLKLQGKVLELQVSATVGEHPVWREFRKEKHHSLCPKSYNDVHEHLLVQKNAVETFRKMDNIIVSRIPSQEKHSQFFSCTFQKQNRILKAN